MPRNVTLEELLEELEWFFDGKIAGLSTEVFIKTTHAINNLMSDPAEAHDAFEAIRYKREANIPLPFALFLINLANSEKD